MSIELNMEQLSITKDKCPSKTRIINEADIIVPDSKPDAVRVLEADAVPQINEKYISRDYLTLSGTINYRILYVSDGGTVESIDYTAPFSQQIDAQGADDGMTSCVHCSVSHVEHTVRNSRKLNVKSAIDVSAHAYDMSSVSVVSGVEADISVPSRTAEAESFNLALCSESTFGIDDTVKLPAASPVIDEILKCDIRMAESELKVVTNKAVAKGMLTLTTLYRSEGEICCAENEIPFTQITDVDSVTADMYTEADYDIKNLSCARELDDDGTMSLINVRADICMTIRAYEEKSFGYISDVYSPDYDIEVESAPLTIGTLADTATAQHTVNESVPFDDGCTVDKIYSMTTSVCVERCVISCNRVEIGGFVTVCLLGRGECGVCSAQRQIPFEHEMPLSRAVDERCARAFADAAIEHASYNIESDTSVQVRIVLRISSKVMCERTVNAITSIALDEEKKIDKSAQSGITVYFVQSGDELWDIAKRYHTTSEDILDANRLESDVTLSVGQQLLIPKRN